MSPIKSPRQLAIADGRATYVGARGCSRCRKRKRYTKNGGCVRCQALRVKAEQKRAQEHARLLDVPVTVLADSMRPAPAAAGVCPTCGRRWSR